MTTTSNRNTRANKLVTIALRQSTTELADHLINLAQRVNPDWMDQFGEGLVGANLGYRQHHGLVSVREHVALRAGEGRRLRDARRFNGCDPRYTNDRFNCI
jgi:hypothetical protein